MDTKKLSLLSRLLLLVGAIMLAVSIFVPIWRIELGAPQYPEGLVMKIYANKLGGDVEIINGLNHYIGMATLHAENFIEFSILTYIIAAYSLLILLTAILSNKKILYFSFSAFTLFGILAMVDFWRWEYNYGHHLDPNAAIIVPGMSYQPPLIGYKQLLNFGAYSVPDIGGWLFIGCGLIMLIALLYEVGFFNRFKKVKKTVVMAVLSSVTLLSCSNVQTEPIVLNKFNCDFCEMTISDGRFAAELITAKGRIYKFDDLNCMLRYRKENHKTNYQSFWVNDYNEKNTLIPAESSFYVYAQSIKSPMGGNTAAFSSKEKAEEFAKGINAKISNWETISK